MNETSKSHNLRLMRHDFDLYFQGQVIDIGCGSDPIKTSIPPVCWDIADGDAMLMSSIPPNTFDTVYSSHCLEHLMDINIALSNWVRICKPNGFLYIVVPDYTLYEKRTWPSLFNCDHKHSFSLTIVRETVNRSNHFNILENMVPLMADLNCALIRAELEDLHYDYHNKNEDQTMGPALAQICTIWRKNG